MIKNICINCLDKLIREREEKNNQINEEKEQITSNIETLTQEVESEEFSKICCIKIYFISIFQSLILCLKIKLIR